MSYFGVDVSSWNELPDWSRVHEVDFAILRITDRYGTDTSFEHNYTGATAAGIKVGVYKFSYAVTAEGSRKEAEDVLNVLAGRHLDFPVFLDLEWSEQEAFPKELIGEIIEGFREVITAAGYKFGIYCNRYWYNNLIPESAHEKYPFWIASVPQSDKDHGALNLSIRPTFGIGWQYSWRGTVDGIGTGNVDVNLFYTNFGEGKEMVTVKDVLDKATSYIGCNEADGSHKMIVDLYNSHKPPAREYAVKYTDEWCDTFVSAVFIALDATDAIGGTECGVEEHVKLFKAAGIWIEDGSITPEPGDIIVFNWDTNTQPNDGYSDHIGFVENVTDGIITTIEGNCNDSVMRRPFKVGDGRIRGFARPKYVQPISIEEPVEVDCGEVEAAEPVESGEGETEGLPVLCKGIMSPYVAKLQGCLNALNKCDLELDGEFGWMTYNEVVAFQSAHGCEVDGVVGKVTWAAIKDALHDEIELCKLLLKQLE